MKTVRIRGLEYTRYAKNAESERRRIKKKYFDEHGRHRLVGPNGRYLAMVREDPDPNGELIGGQPSAEELSADKLTADRSSTIDVEGESVNAEPVTEERIDSVKRRKNSGLIQSVPKPKSCQCRAWPDTNVVRAKDEKGRPLEHHAKCAWKKPYEKQKGTKITQVLMPNEQPRSMPSRKPVNSAKLLPTRVPGVKQPVEKLKPKKREEIPNPFTCHNCGPKGNVPGWKKPKGADDQQHHPNCMFFEPWKKHEAERAARAEAERAEAERAAEAESGYYLFDLTTRKELRPAEPEEVEAAHMNEKESSAPLIELEGKQYLVAQRSELGAGVNA